MMKASLGIGYHQYPDGSTFFLDLFEVGRITISFGNSFKTQFKIKGNFHSVPFLKIRTGYGVKKAILL
jgi:hypothetical protein